jgi:2-amino-4-hydroxy-6-hydroxymethyldihydropteridine diphosphokinase
MIAAAIALGSNLGNRLEYIRSGVAAIGAVPGTRLVAISSIIETPALVAPGAEPGPDYLNAVVLVETDLEPGELLRGLLQIEHWSGRDRTRATRWAARTLDLDVLFVGDRVVASDELTLPHPRLHERPFVLRPLAQVAPGWVHPGHGLTALQMLAKLEAERAKGPA